jgi:hypothetical protein
MIHVNKIIKPSRRALIIGCPGFGEDYLYSVSSDVDNINQFLLSPRGGRWKKEEITILYNPGIEKFKEEVGNVVADYVFVYFAGHGFEYEGMRMICLKNDDIADIALLNDSPRQLVIIDACRVKEYPAISGLPEDQKWFPADGVYPEREAFDKYILQSPPGKKIVHATKSGEVAYEYINSRGGIFTLNLLRAAARVTNETGYSPIQIEQAVLKAISLMKRNGDQQQPEIVYMDGCLTVPFALTIKSKHQYLPMLANKNMLRKRGAQKVTADPGLVVFGIFAVLILASIGD